MRRHWPELVLAAVAALAGAAVLAQGVQGPTEVDGRKSGYEYLGPDTKALQDDDFLNPGMFAVDAGAALWSQRDGREGKSCADCHGDAASSMAGVAARYPVFDRDLGRMMNLELRINDERQRRMGADPYPWESDELIALTTYISTQSRGMPMSVAIDGPAAPWFERGREFFYRRMGQLDLSCAQCHEDHAGDHLRGDLLDQGQINDFPIYRLLWHSMGSRHRMFRWCNENVRAEPYDYGADEYLALELYLAWRGRGLGMESPAVRR